MIWLSVCARKAQVQKLLTLCVTLKTEPQLTNPNASLLSLRWELDAVVVQQLRSRPGLPNTGD